VPPSAPARQRPVLAIGEEHPGPPPPACSSPDCTPAAGRPPWSRRCTSTGGSCAPTASAATSPAKNSGGEYAASSTRARACTRCAAPCSSPIRATFAANLATRPTRRSASHWSPTPACAYPGDALDQPLRQARNRGRGRSSDVVRDESQPLDPSDGTVPCPVVEHAKAEEVSPAGGATDFDSAGTNNPIPEMADLRAAGRTTDSAISSAESALRASTRLSTQRGVHSP
jgi:hypothetical protein